MRPGRGLLGVMQRSKISLFNERGEIGAQAVRKRHRQQRVAVASVAVQYGGGQAFRARELLLEMGALLRIGLIFLARAEDRVVLIRIALPARRGG